MSEQNGNLGIRVQFTYYPYTICSSFSFFFLLFNVSLNTKDEFNSLFTWEENWFVCILLIRCLDFRAYRNLFLGCFAVSLKIDFFALKTIIIIFFKLNLF